MSTSFVCKVEILRRLMAGWGNFFGKIADQFQGRIERLKNEKERLLNERKTILNGVATASSTDRIIAIDNRLREINTALDTKASD